MSGRGNRESTATWIAAEGTVVRAIPGGVACPGFIDLYGDLAGSADVEAARLGGFARTLGVPDGKGSGAGVQPLCDADGSPGDTGESSEVLVFSGGRSGVESDRILDRLLRYAAGLDALVFIRPTSASLESGAIVRCGPLAVRYGLPSVSPTAEAISVRRIAGLAADHGTRVHFTHLWSAAGVAAVRDVKDARITASTTVHHLVTPQSVVERLHGPVRMEPVLGDEADQAALRDALIDGTLDAVATDHRPASIEATSGPIQEVFPGQVCAGFAWAAVASVVGHEVAARAFTYGPARVLGVEPHGVTRLDLEGETVAEGPLLGSGRNTPLLGMRWSGRVVSE